MLSEVVLILDILRSRLNVLVDDLGPEGHLCYFLENNCVMNSLVAVLSPCERSVVSAKNTRNCLIVDAALVEFLTDDNTRVKLVLAFDLLCRERSGTRDISVEIVSVCSSVARNVTACLSP